MSSKKNTNESCSCDSLLSDIPVGSTIEIQTISQSRITGVFIGVEDDCILQLDTPERVTNVCCSSIEIISLIQLPFPEHSTEEHPHKKRRTNTNKGDNVGCLCESLISDIPIGTPVLVVTISDNSASGILKRIVDDHVIQLFVEGVPNQVINVCCNKIGWVSGSVQPLLNFSPELLPE